MPKKPDPFGDTTFIRIEMHSLGYGYNLLSGELDKLMKLNDYPPETFVELNLLSGSIVWARRGCISDFTISSPESRAFNQELEEADGDGEAKPDWLP